MCVPVTDPCGRGLSWLQPPNSLPIFSSHFPRKPPPVPIATALASVPSPSPKQAIGQEESQSLGALRARFSHLLHRGVTTRECIKWTILLSSRWWQSDWRGAFSLGRIVSTCPTFPRILVSTSLTSQCAHPETLLVGTRFPQPPFLFWGLHHPLYSSTHTPGWACFMCVSSHNIHTCGGQSTCLILVCREMARRALGRL